MVALKSIPLIRGSERRMTIEQTVAIPANYRIFLELPRSVPIGAQARVFITIPTAYESQSSAKPVKPLKSMRGILKGKGITIERFREMQREDKALEDAADERLGSWVR